MRRTFLPFGCAQVWRASYINRGVGCIVDGSRLVEGRADHIDVSIVVPVYNEVDHLAHSIQHIASLAAIVSSSIEIVIVDDGSNDGTWMHLIDMPTTSHEITMIQLSRNFGKEAALTAGLDAARGNAVITMDADLQHPPEFIPLMIGMWRDEGYDIIEGVKRSRGKESNRNRMGSFVFYTIIEKLSGYRMRNVTDFKLLDRKVVEAWKQMPERSTFFRGMTAWLGFRQCEFEFDVRDRAGGSSKWGTIKLMRLAIEAVISFSSFPLRIVTWIGVLFLIFSILLGAQTLYLKISGMAVTGFTTVILVQLLTGSAVFIFLGVIGEYIAAIYNEVKKRPRYVIREMKRRHTMEEETATSSEAQ